MQVNGHSDLLSRNIATLVGKFISADDVVARLSWGPTLHVIQLRSRP